MMSGTRASFAWEKTGIPRETPRGRAGDNVTFPQTTPGIEPRSHW